MWKKAGDLSYVGFTEDGAQWLVDNTDIKLIGKKLFPASIELLQYQIVGLI
jgi:hypothetical protein